MATKRAPRIATRLLDLPDIGAKIGQLDRAEGALLKAGEVEDADAVQGPAMITVLAYGPVAGGLVGAPILRAALARPADSRLRHAAKAADAHAAFSPAARLLGSR